MHFVEDPVCTALVWKFVGAMGRYWVAFLSLHTITLATKTPQIFTMSTLDAWPVLSVSCLPYMFCQTPEHHVRKARL